jgi:hypothetical protein
MVCISLGIFLFLNRASEVEKDKEIESNIGSETEMSLEGCFEGVVNGSLSIPPENGFEDSDYLILTLADGVCEFQKGESSEEDSILLRTDHLEEGQFTLDLVYRYSLAACGSVESYIRTQVGSEVKNFKAQGFPGDARVEIASDYSALLFYEDNWKVLDLSTLEVSDVDIFQELDDEKFSEVGRYAYSLEDDLDLLELKYSPHWSNGNFLFAIKQRDDYGYNTNNDGEKYVVIYNLEKGSTNQVLVKEYFDSRACAANCPYLYYVYGSWGIADDQVLYYTTFSEGESEVDPSRYGVVFVGLEDKEELLEVVLKEYIHEEIRSLENYLAEIKIVNATVSTTPKISFEYFFLEPDLNGSKTVVSENQRYLQE